MHEFNPTRSLIFLRVAREEYRHRLRHWWYRYHCPESIAQFEPYVSKYAFYPSLPTPDGGDVFGAHNYGLTEHYWLINDFDPRVKNKTFGEFFPPDVLRWQGNIPDIDPLSHPNNLNGDRARGTDCSSADDATSPFIFAFVTVWWDEDIKGLGRTVEDGPNYRWLCLIGYPDGVSEDDGEEWFRESFLPPYEKHPAVTRILASKVLRDLNHMPFHRLVEIWFDGPEEWTAVVEEARKQTPKPTFAQTDIYPYLQKYTNIASLFLSDIAEINALSQYRGYITMR
jgi:hypothetical protein